MLFLQWRFLGSQRVPPVREENFVREEDAGISRSDSFNSV